MDKQSISTVRDYQQFMARNAAREVLTGLGVILDFDHFTAADGRRYATLYTKGETQERIDEAAEAVYLACK